MNEALDGRVAAETIITMGEQLADAMGYQRIDHPNWPNASRLWYDPGEEKVGKKKHRRPKYVQGPRHSLIVADPRSLFISHDDYLAWIRVDSTYRGWIVYTEGNPNPLERVLMTLWEGEPWSNIRNPWIEDARKREGMTRNKWVGLTGSTRMHSHPDDLEPGRSTSTPTTSKNVPTFGDLSSLAKPLRRKKA